MSHRYLAAALAAISVAVLTPMFAAAQSTDTAPPPRTSWGQPDLQGVWDFRTITPLERPAEFSGQKSLTDEEASGLEREAVDRIARLAAPSEVRTEPLPAGGGGQAVGAYNNFWFDAGTTVIEDRRTSLIEDPPDGRLPALRPTALE